MSPEDDIRFFATQNKQAQIPITPPTQRNPLQINKNTKEPNSKHNHRKSDSTNPPTSSPNNVHDYSDLGFVLRSIDHDEAFREETLTNTKDWATGQRMTFSPAPGNYHGGIQRMECQMHRGVLSER
ncbi:MAG: hypothetical protein Q9216_006816 [Gyalolechia sp. 2 TL-2023]